MAVKKSTKKILLLLLAFAAAVFAYFRFRTDKMGGRMTLSNETGVNTYYNGKKVIGYLDPGSLKLVNGYWQGTANGVTYQYRENGFVGV